MKTVIKSKLVVLILANVVLLGTLLFAAYKYNILRPADRSIGLTDPRITAFSQEHGLSEKQWPDYLVNLMRANPETEEFVLNYPLRKDDNTPYTLDELKYTDEVPLLMQWDQRWGYNLYAGELMGISGCGPTCLSMVYIYLTGDTSFDPGAAARFSAEKGFSEYRSGSAWTLISQGGPMLGLDVTEIPLDRDRIFRNLEAGNPIICVMGEGDFTKTGHFIVLTGCEGGLIKVNDPNSGARSEKLWEYEKMESQFRNLWVCRLA